MFDRKLGYRCYTVQYKIVLSFFIGWKNVVIYGRWFQKKYYFKNILLDCKEILKSVAKTATEKQISEKLKQSLTNKNSGYQRS